MTNIYLTLLTAFSGLAWAELDLKQLCLSKSLNEVVAHPLDCRGYIMCSKQPTEHYCDVGFHFDIKRLLCNWPENVNCTLASQPMDSIKPVYTSLTALDIMTGEIIDPLNAYDPLNVACRHFGAYFLPNPQQCRSYYLCAYGHIHQHNCGPNTLWDYKIQQCVLNHKANCYHLAAEEKREINEALTYNMENSTLVCYPADAINTTTDIFHADDSKHTGPITLTTTAIPSASTSPKKPNLFNPFEVRCDPRRQGYKAHPKDCSKYFICIVGTPVMTSCPKGLLWDPKKEYCHSSSNVKCLQPKNS